MGEEFVTDGIELAVDAVRLKVTKIILEDSRKWIACIRIQSHIISTSALIDSHASIGEFILKSDMGGLVGRSLSCSRVRGDSKAEFRIQQRRSCRRDLFCFLCLDHTDTTGRGSSSVSLIQQLLYSRGFPRCYRYEWR